MQLFNYPKNVSSPSLMTTTSSLINNNSLLTFRDIMMQQHHHHQHYQLQQLRKNENENCIQSSSISHASSLQPSSSLSLSPNAMHFHNTAEKHETTHHPLSINKHETVATVAAACGVENGNKLNSSANRCNKAESFHQYGGGSGKTVREELEASRNKIPKLGELNIFKDQVKMLNFFQPALIIFSTNFLSQKKLFLPDPLFLFQCTGQ